MKQGTAHKGELPYLRKIEGQIRGVQKMIEERRYCVDILNQLSSIVGAIKRVERKVFREHLEGCVAHALKGKSEREKDKKIDEIINLISKFGKGA